MMMDGTINHLSHLLPSPGQQPLPPPYQLIVIKCDFSNFFTCFPKVKKEHLNRSINFLVDELKYVDKGQAEDRVFFVSAQEVGCWIFYIGVYKDQLQTTLNKSSNFCYCYVKRNIIQDTRINISIWTVPTYPSPDPTTVN